MFALTQGRVFTGYDVLDGHAVIIANGLIERVYPEAQLPAGIETHDLRFEWRTPGPRIDRCATERLWRRAI